jgi:hypothetical protein
MRFCGILKPIDSSARPGNCLIAKGAIAIALAALLVGLAQPAAASSGCDKVTGGSFNLPAGDLGVRTATEVGFAAGDQITFNIVIAPSSTGYASRWRLELTDPRTLLTSTEASGPQAYTITDSEAEKIITETALNNVGVTATCKPR